MISAVAFAGLTLAGCAGLGIGGGRQAIGYTSARAALTLYRDGYQAAVLDYGHLPVCGGGATFCRDQNVWNQLKAIDAQVTPAIDKANEVLHGLNGDPSSLTAMMTATATAETKITALGLKPKP